VENRWEVLLVVVASPAVYTRPEVITWDKKKYKVPPVLLTGDHKKIDAWKNSKKK
jgi:tRNA G37 N-methylase TrmD